MLHSHTQEVAALREHMDRCSFQAFSDLCTICIATRSGQAVLCRGFCCYQALMQDGCVLWAEVALSARSAACCAYASPAQC